MEKSSGAAQKNISVKDIKNIEIPLPPLPEQKKIVAHLDQVHGEITALKQGYEEQLVRYDELWASTLDKAFKGELV